MLVEGDLSHRWRGVLDEDGALIIGRVLEQTLAEVVSEWIHHQLGEVQLDFVEDELEVLPVALLELLL